MICAVLVIVPGDGVAWSQRKNPRQDIAAFQHRLDVFDFVRIGCRHNDVLPITFSELSEGMITPANYDPPVPGDVLVQFSLPVSRRGSLSKFQRVQQPTIG